MKGLKTTRWLLLILIIASFAMTGLFFPPTPKKNSNLKEAVVTNNGTPIVAQPIGGSAKTLQFVQLSLITVTPGAVTATPTTISTPTPTPGSSTVDTDSDGYLANVDCDDNDPNVHPNQTQFFDHPRSNGSWDYDCSGITEHSAVSTSTNAHVLLSSQVSCCAVAHSAGAFCSASADLHYSTTLGPLPNDATCGNYIYVAQNPVSTAYSTTTCSPGTNLGYAYDGGSTGVLDKCK